MKEKIKKRGLKWKVESAGTSSWHVGDAPDPRSQEMAKRYGIDICEQRGRQFSPYDFEKYDRIYVMDRANYNDVMRLAMTDEERRKVELILNEAFPGANKQVPDPYWNDDGFEQVYRMLDEACERIIQKYGNVKN